MWLGLRVRRVVRSSGCGSCSCWWLRGMGLGVLRFVALDVLLVCINLAEPATPWVLDPCLLLRGLRGAHFACTLAFLLAFWFPAPRTVSC